MDKRKKSVKLFNDIKAFINENRIDTSPHAFLLNRFFLTVNNKRAGNLTLKGIDKQSFSTINKRFEDRLKRDYILSLSISTILSLPSKKVFEIDNVKASFKPAILLLTDSVALSYEIEKKSMIHIGYQTDSIDGNPFQNVEYYPVSRETPFSISLQSTLFDLISNDNTKLKPYSFDIIFDDSVNYGFPSDSLIENISNLLKVKGEFHMMIKKNFFSSPLTKKNKKVLYSLFSTNEINRFNSFLYMKLEKKSDSFILQPGNVVIRNHVENKVLKVEKGHLDFNNLLTFDDGISPEQISLLSKIESKATTSCGDCFKFFIGMFKEQGVVPNIETLRKSSRYKPFIRSREIEPYSLFHVNHWIIPDKESFFQIPPVENFEREKLILRYLSVKPVFAYDNSGLYFLNDVAAVIPRTNEIELLFAEGYFNSKVIDYYYRIKFPHHNKFLKKNFNKIPFFLCSRSIQKIISDLVREIREINESISLKGKERSLDGLKRSKMDQLDKFLYQLFKLSQEEIKIIEDTVS